MAEVCDDILHWNSVFKCKLPHLYGVLEDMWFITLGNRMLDRIQQDSSNFQIVLCLSTYHCRDHNSMPCLFQGVCWALLPSSGLRRHSNPSFAYKTISFVSGKFLQGVITKAK